MIVAAAVLLELAGDVAAGVAAELLEVAADVAVAAVLLADGKKKKAEEDAYR